MIQGLLLVGIYLNAISPPVTNAGTASTQPRQILDLKQIKQIIELMKRSELSEFAVEEEGFKLKIRRGGNGLPVVSSSRSSNHPFAATPEQVLPPAQIVTQPAGNAVNAQVAPVKDDADAIYIKSPMVGTFYRAPSPESKPFADIGAKVSESSVVCLIEAMKIMNEIQAEVKGTITEVLIENGQPVEYGQRLFKLKQG
jgi:acetyl-CoA carboxylase biotin carboxyl carrier protein